MKRNLSTSTKQRNSPFLSQNTTVNAVVEGICVDILSGCNPRVLSQFSRLTSFPNDRTVANELAVLLNEMLPSSVRVHFCHVVPKSFHSERDCTQRRYEYIIPLSAFHPESSSTDIQKFIKSQFIKHFTVHGSRPRRPKFYNFSVGVQPHNSIVCYRFDFE